MSSNVTPLVPGNIDLHKRPVVRNPDGSISTVRSMGVNIDGREVLIPTVSDDGRILSDDAAVDAYRRTGKHLGMFRTPEESTAYAEQLHNDQAREYLPHKRGGSLSGKLEALGQGLTFRFGDEMGAGLQEGLARLFDPSAKPGETYRQALAENRTNLAAEKAENPWGAAALEAVGGIPSTIALGGLGLGGTGIGALSGGLSGVGGGEDATSRTIGGLFGTAGGAALGKAAEVLPGALAAGVREMPPAFHQLAQRLVQGGRNVATDAGEAAERWALRNGSDAALKAVRGLRSGTPNAELLAKAGAMGSDVSEGAAGRAAAAEADLLRQKLQVQQRTAGIPGERPNPHYGSMSEEQVQTLGKAQGMQDKMTNEMLQSGRQYETAAVVDPYVRRVLIPPKNPGPSQQEVIDKMAKIHAQRDAIPTSDPRVGLSPDPALNKRLDHKAMLNDLTRTGVNPRDEQWTDVVSNVFEDLLGKTVRRAQ
jgi:hypothetical protein